MLDGLSKSRDCVASANETVSDCAGQRSAVDSHTGYEAPSPPGEYEYEYEYE